MPTHPHIEKIKARVEKMRASIEEAEHKLARKKIEYRQERDRLQAAKNFDRRGEIPLSKEELGMMLRMIGWKMKGGVEQMGGWRNHHAGYQTLVLEGLVHRGLIRGWATSLEHHVHVVTEEGFKLLREYGYAVTEAQF